MPAFQAGVVGAIPTTRTMKQKCPKCSTENPTDFRKIIFKNNNSLCRGCNRTLSERRRSSKRERKEYMKEYACRISGWRKSKQHVERWILQDARKWDAKHGMKFDLTKEFIQKMIKNGCEYCGENNLRMTLDRIDNTKGHTKDNVRPACIRCNYLRRDMPYQAWLRLFPVVREIRELGLFGEWLAK